MRLLLAGVLLLTACGTSTDRQTKIVERVTTHTAPVTIDTPVGQIVVQPSQVTTSRESYETEQARTSVEGPSLGPVLTAAASGTPIGAILGAIAGLGGAGAALHQMLRAKTVARQRDELIDSVEAGSEQMTDKQWAAFSARFKQSPDTKAAIKKRVG